MLEPVDLQDSRLLITGATGQVAEPVIAALSGVANVTALARFAKPEDRERIAPFLERMGVTYPVYTVNPDDYPLLFTEGSIPVPLSILLNEEGEVEALFSGWSRETRRHLRSLMDH